MNINNPCRKLTVVIAALALLVAGPRKRSSRTATIRSRSPSCRALTSISLAPSTARCSRKAGYRVEYVNADYNATFPAVKAGDVHVTMGWDTSPDLINDAVNSGKAIRAGLERCRDCGRLVVSGVCRGSLSRLAKLRSP